MDWTNWAAIGSAVVVGAVLILWRQPTDTWKRKDPVDRAIDEYNKARLDEFLGRKP